jgi:hypothetical protein
LFSAASLATASSTPSYALQQEPEQEQAAAAAAAAAATAADAHVERHLAGRSSLLIRHPHYQ